MSPHTHEYVQYGCGYLCHPPGWINFDASPTLVLQKMPLIGGLMKRIVKPRFPDEVRYGDIVKGLPIQKCSCKGIYCSHVLEHLCLNDFRIALRNTYDYLMPEGIFRLVMPDLFDLAQRYVNSSDPIASFIFLKSSSLGESQRRKSILNFLHEYLGNSRHLWLWDFNSTKIELEKAGFSDIRRAKYGDSENKRFIEAEDIDRWDNCLGIECTK
jgi:hypothetical protein